MMALIQTMTIICSKVIIHYLIRRYLLVIIILMLLWRLLQGNDVPKVLMMVQLLIDNLVTGIGYFVGQQQFRRRR